ncbi:hypothetical protein DUNSADRAFT_1708 [Dunaliella salina]|uniref:Secreted protein n=1 Tax=Dunaliella salina TaxID=3046 RepID=A0ABQ7FX51_DUNSA|nr:hypothetical protein DUNSADRAFT_1708 [Dunaliella salina]|eukprot:KAF5826942.1 hypothetical protein DUNSADRAFT_1708 [Dunaliella salina]
MLLVIATLPFFWFSREYLQARFSRSTAEMHQLLQCGCRWMTRAWTCSDLHILGRTVSTRHHKQHWLLLIIDTLGARTKAAVSTCKIWVHKAESLTGVPAGALLSWPRIDCKENNWLLVGQEVLYDGPELIAVRAGALLLRPRSVINKLTVEMLSRQEFYYSTVAQHCVHFFAGLKHSMAVHLLPRFPRLLNAVKGHSPAAMHFE